MKVSFEAHAFAEYNDWQKKNKKTFTRIQALITDIMRDPTSRGTGKAERLRHDRSGFCSRRIDKANRLVYQIEGDNITIVSCSGHYD